MAQTEVDALWQRLQRLERLLYGLTPASAPVEALRQHGGFIRSLAHVSRTSGAVVDAASQEALLEQRLDAVERSLLYSPESRIETVLALEKSIVQMQEYMDVFERLSSLVTAPLPAPFDPSSVRQFKQRMDTYAQMHHVQTAALVELEARTAHLAQEYGRLMREISLQFAHWSALLDPPHS